MLVLPVVVVPLLALLAPLPVLEAMEGSGELVGGAVVVVVLAPFDAVLLVPALLALMVVRLVPFLLSLLLSGAGPLA